MWIALASLVALSSPQLSATPPAHAEVVSGGRRANAIYVQADVLPMLIFNTGAMSLNYDRRLGEWLSVHAGIGYSSWGELLSGAGAQAMAGELEVKFVGGGDNHFFEWGAGVAAVDVYHAVPGEHCDDDYDEDGGDPCAMRTGVRAMPVFSLGYRYQPHLGGVFFRAGVGVHYGYGMGASFGIGRTF
jgi:hypothetical protein